MWGVRCSLAGGGHRQSTRGMALTWGKHGQHNSEVLFAGKKKDQRERRRATRKEGKEASRPGLILRLATGLPLLGLWPRLLGLWPGPHPGLFGSKFKAKRYGP